MRFGVKFAGGCFLLGIHMPTFQPFKAWQISRRISVTWKSTKLHWALIDVFVRSFWYWVKFGDKKSSTKDWVSESDLQMSISIGKRIYIYIYLIKLARDLTRPNSPKWWFSKGIPRKFQETPGWWNIISFGQIYFVYLLKFPTPEPEIDREGNVLRQA